MIRQGQSVVVVKQGKHPLVIGAPGVVLEVFNDGIARLAVPTFGVGIAHVPVDCLKRRSV